MTQSLQDVLNMNGDMANYGSFTSVDGTPQTNDQAFNTQYAIDNKYSQATNASQKTSNLVGVGSYTLGSGTAFGGSSGGGLPQYSSAQLQQMLAKDQGSPNAMAALGSLVTQQANTGGYFGQAAQAFSTQLSAQLQANNPMNVMMPTQLTQAQVASQVSTQLNSILQTSGADPLMQSLGLKGGVSNTVDQSRQLILQGMVNHYAGVQTAPIAPVTNLPGH